MSALDTIRDALFGNPPVAAFKPSREGVYTAFGELYSIALSAMNGVVLYTTKALMDADTTRAPGTQARVTFDSTPANNKNYIRNSAGTAWVTDVDFYNAVAAVVQPLLDLSRNWASLASGPVDNTNYPGILSSLQYAQLSGRYANSNTDVDVTGGAAGERGAKFLAALSGRFANDATDVQVSGQADTTARGAKYWSLQAAIAAGGLSTLGVVLPAIPVDAAVFAEFTKNKYYNQGATSIVLATWLSSLSGTFTRSGSSTYINSSGLRVAGTTNTPRPSYNPVTLAPLGIMYEAVAATQIFTNTDDITTVTWQFANSGTVRTSNVATGPDGTTSADFLKQDATTGIHDMWYREPTATITSGLFYAFQVWMKPGGTTKINLLPYTGMGLGGVVTVDFTAGTVTGTGWTIEAWQNGWFRVWKSSTATTTGTSDVHFYLLDASGSNSFAGDNTSGVYFGGIQYEQVATAGAPPTSYIPRVTSAATRGAEALTFTIPTGVTKLTYTLGNGSFAPVATVAPGAYTIPALTQTSIQSLITVDLAVVGSPVLSVAGMTGAVILLQAHIGGLTVTSTPTFQGLNITNENISLGGSILKNISATGTFQWTTGATARTDRCVLIGSGAANSVTSAFQNSGPIIGNDAVKNTVTLATSVVLGDTAGGSSPLVSGSVLIGNEAGNGPSISGSNIIGNLSRCGYTGATVTRCDVMGQSAMLNNGCVDTVAIGQSVGLGINPTAGSTINQSVMLGSQAGKLSGGATITNLILIGYNIQAPTATTSNYISIGDVFVGSMAGTVPVFTVQKPGGAAAALAASQFRPGGGTPIWTSGTGSPETVLTAPIGSMYTRIDGGANTTLYIKESGAGNTGWIAK